MVSKIAVAALVLILACPILLGYAMNFNETTETVYAKSGDPVNVTQLLTNGVEYGYTNSNVFDLNTKFGSVNDNYSTYPDYASITSNKTSFPLSVYTSDTEWFPSEPSEVKLFSNYSYFDIIFDYDPADGGVWFSPYYKDGDNLYSRNPIVTKAHEIYYDFINHNVNGTEYVSDGNGGYELVPFSRDDTNAFLFIYNQSIDDVDVTFYYLDAGTTPTDFVDLSAGFYLNKHFLDPDADYAKTYISLPNNPRNLLLTVDLATITDSSHTFTFYTQTLSNDYLRFVKTTDGSGEHWNLYDGTSVDPITELYYDSARSSNTYQVYMTNDSYQLRYVGDWPKIFGPANYYITYEGNWTHPANTNLGKVYVVGVSPLMRVDDSEYRAFEYKLMNNKTYNPSDFKTNPSTTISNVNIYGTALRFGGNTYDVTNGNITLGTHTVAVTSLVFDSVPIYGGYYENRINGNVISVTAEPSTIRFDGKWSANIITDSMESTTVNKTEWIAGEFAWDGIDDNFLMVGLLTSLGVFIALGIYSRRSKSSVWPLMLVAGGAAFVFLLMM